ncbi:MAG: ABC transporter permease [Verrucomicrobia bacterium]|nr:ABC transporter permease [Verrucomicrobiota bacterium]
MPDLRHAFRSLARTPGFTVVAALTLALGIGASTAIFSVVHALLLSPLRYGDARPLVQLRSSHPQQGFAGLAPATVMEIATTAQSFETVAAQTYYYYNLTKIGTAARITGLQATADYFKLWQVAPLLGRTWNADDCRAASPPVVVLSEQIWRKYYAANPGILDQPITIDDVAVTVIGIMPASFQDPWGNGGLWRPIATDGDAPRDRSSRYWSPFARLRPGVTLAQANAELATLAARLSETYPENYRGWTLVTGDLQRAVVGDYRTGLLVILGAVGCVMLITCTNVAGLNVVRAAARRKELAVRIALGASRGQLLGELLAESLLLALIGGVGGVLLGSWGIDALLATLPGGGGIPRADEIALNGPVLAAALLLTLVTGLVFGLAPGFTAARVDANDALKATARSSAHPAVRRVRSILVVTEIALDVFRDDDTGEMPAVCFP